MDPLDTKKRIFAAHKLLTEKTTSKQKLESVKALIKGINPRIDTFLENSSKALTDLEKFQKGDVIELGAEHLPENTEEEKKRKKALLWFIRNWKSLHSEIDRVKKEFEQGSQGTEQKIQSGGRIAAFAKGPFGLMTALAIVIVISLSVIGGKKTALNQSELDSGLPSTDLRSGTGAKTKVIVVDGKQIPLIELTTGQGSECLDGSSEAPHYHAKDHIAAKALDGSSVTDPGGCGFGKVKEVNIIEVE
ncbi:hypothetical protein A3A46_02925 [Candidatus Roizmanbacteria bacterium RIFCSPLOWO2_01_FULL_37_13]|uniref:Uncharacterized protein n=1 Tax=Candidatus Roizmanbacteria bacterium RIFCSPHIGHO2_02_FULL_38_11 TaxID=1802039 RepID=A0A1F7GXE5_9BACT|nr:MAG: hypothetical protein A3C25_00795 [Candidatus Roizmanbacteria bacterium RIFCSPHIGHO2_02_FULL_38_11]OGK42662.1 MAG: hypothetical protein A3A46_02925 [Candidatus Roizmanbacteria bacterium RIFCSPLOWO2_01_FULL_37_13]